MKRIVLSIVVLLVLLCGIAVAEEKSIVASGNCGASGSNLTWALDSEGTLTISGKGKMKDYVHRFPYDNHPWYSNHNSIKTVVIETGVTSISDEAFMNYSSLSSITIPKGLKSIGVGVFDGCNSLSKVYVDSLDSWLGISFSSYDSTPLFNGGELYIAGELTTDLVLPAGLTSIGEYAFSGYSSLSSITIPEGVTSIGEYAFESCTSLSSISLPDGVTSIGNCAFNGCSSLSSITIPDGVTSIGAYTFSGCSSLSSITIPDGVTSIGAGAFEGCSNLSSITIPEGVTSIGASAFRDCSNLTSIVIPEGVTKIEFCTFYFCTSLTNVTIPASVTRISNEAFMGCNSKLLFINPKSSYVISWASKHGFQTSAPAPVSVNVNGIIYDLFNDEATVTGCEGKPSAVVIPAQVNGCTVTIIGDEVFDGHMELTNVTLPETLTIIGNSAFYNCSSLSSITIPDGVTSIGESAFNNCSSLSSIDIPAGVTSIGDGAFHSCSSLSSITIPESVTSIGEYAFYSCSSLSSIELPAGLTEIGDSAFWNCSSLSSIELPAGVTSIGNSAFWNCSSLSSITLPASLTSIGADAFCNCSSLSSISLPAGLGSIGSNAFNGCSSLSSITIPEGVTSIDVGTFSGCSSLSSITIPDGVTSIGNSAFFLCSSLSSITIPDSVTSIGDWAFNNCSKLSSITIPEGVTSIGNDAFRDCSILRKVMFLGNDMPALGSNVFSTSPTIYCYEFSDVDIWAFENGYNCVYIDDMDLNTPISITLPQDMRIEMGENRTISAGLFPQTAKAEIVWQSSDPSVVSVENGVLTAKAVGEATITASCDELSDQMNITVYAFVESFELSEAELWVISKQSAQLDICNIQPAGATASFTWGSSDTSVLTVSSGKITALKPGDATVTVTSDNGVVRSCLVHVCYPVTAIELEKSAYQLTVGSDAQITANVTMRSQSCVNRLVTFTSSDEAVATVDQTGSIHAVSPGTATITVSAASGVTASCAVTVEPCTHIPVTDPAVPATHVTTGLTEGSHCSVCGEVLVAQQTIPVVEVPMMTLPAELEIIEEEAFAGNTFVCVVIPECCKKIGAGAFKDCAKLRFVEIPDTVTSIDGSAFEGCGDNLIIVTVSGSEAERFANVQGIICVLC